MALPLPQLQPLPVPGLLGRLMDGQPWLVSAVLIVAGSALYIALRNQNRQRQGALLGGGLVLAALALQLIAYLVVTERERLAEATMELVRATARGDSASVSQLLAPDASLISELDVRYGPFALGRAGMQRDQILAAVDLLSGRHAVHEYAVLDLQAQQRGPTAGRTQVRVRVTTELERIPSISWWRIDWRKDAGREWRAVIIEPLDLGSPFSRR